MGLPAIKKPLADGMLMSRDPGYSASVEAGAHQSPGEQAQPIQTWSSWKILPHLAYAPNSQFHSATVPPWNSFEDALPFLCLCLGF